MMRTPLITAALLLAAGAAYAQTPVDVTNVWAAETEQFSNFGSDVRFLGDLMIVGAQGQSYRTASGGRSYGSVYVFRQTGLGPYAGYAEEAVLRPAPGRDTYTQYGFSLGACTVPGGDTFVIGGAPSEPFPDPTQRDGLIASAGAAYVHRYDAATGAWVLDTRLAPSDPRRDGQFGYDVSIACDAAPTPGDPPTVDAFVFAAPDLLLWHRDAAGAWSVRQTLAGGQTVTSPPGPAATRPAIAQTGSVGRVTVLRRTGPESAPWAVEATLSSPLTGPDDRFGFGGLAIDRDLIVVGSMNLSPNGVSLGGRAHIFRYTGTGPFGGWAEEAVLTPATPRRYFGKSVAVWAGPAGDGVGARVAVNSDEGLMTFRRDAAGTWREDALLVSNTPSGGVGVLGGISDRHVALRAPFNTNARGTQAGVVRLWDGRSGVFVAGEAAPAPAASRLAVSGANPARLRSEVTVSLAEASAVTVRLFDALGRRVAVLHDGPLGAGETRLAVDAAGLPAGVYVVRAEGAAVAASVRLSVVR